MTLSALTNGRPAVSAIEKSVSTTPSSRLPLTPPMRTWPCTMSLSVFTVKRRRRSCPKSVIVNTSTPTTVSTASAQITMPSPTRTRFMSEGLPDGEVQRQPIQDFSHATRALEWVVRFPFFQLHDVTDAVVIDDLGNDRQVLRHLGLDAEVDTNWANRGRVSEAESRRDRRCTFCERRYVAFANDAEV